MLWLVWLGATVSPIICVVLAYRVHTLRVQREHLSTEAARNPGMIRRIHKGTRIAPGYVYLMRVHEYCKIGHAQNVGSRLSDIQMATPYSVELLHIIGTDHAPRLEVMLQDRFAAQWVRGEWFKLSDEDIAFIRSIESPMRLTDFQGTLYNAVTGKSI